MSSQGYTGLHESAAWRDVSDRAKIRMLGEDRKRLLHAMSTNHIEEMEPGEGRYAFFLNAQGRILADFHVLCLEDSLLIDAEPVSREVIYKHLDQYIIADDVTLEDATEQIVTLTINGPKAGNILKSLGLENLPKTKPPDAQSVAPAVSPGRISWVPFKGGYVADIDLTGAGGYLLFLPSDGTNELRYKLGELSVAEATAEDLRIVRLEHCKPSYGEEITEKYLVQETGQMHAMHFTKGCYLGQEIVERVRSRGQVHRNLRGLLIDAKEPPLPGTKLTVGEDGPEAGEIVSAAYSPGLEKTVAMGYIRTPQADAGTELNAGRLKVMVR